MEAENIHVAVRGIWINEDGEQTPDVDLTVTVHGRYVWSENLLLDYHVDDAGKAYLGIDYGRLYLDKASVQALSKANLKPTKK
jgi:hypothetical protein